MKSKRVAKVIAAFLGSVVLLVVAAVLVLSNTDWGRERVRRIVVNALDDPKLRQVQIGRVGGNLLQGLVLHDVAIRDSAGDPFFSAAEMRTRYGLGALLKKRIVLSDVRVVRPVVILDRPPGGEWNWARIFPTDTTQRDTTSGGFGSWIVFRDVKMIHGHILVRTPWQPEVGVEGQARDSVIAAALDGETRVYVVRAPGGYQQVQDFRDVTGRFPLVRLKHPDHESMRVEVDSLAMVALPFRPPAAVVRQARGVFELTGDSLWWRRAQVRLPGSSAELSGRYGFASSALTLEARARPVALDDVRFIYPALPTDGGGTLDAVVQMDTLRQRYTVRGMDVKTEGAAFAGDIGLELAADTFAFDDTRLRFSGVRTALIERLAPTLDVPRAGVLGGRVALDGGSRALSVNGDVTFDDALAGRNRVVATGLVGIDSSVFSARDLHLTFDPVQVDLARMAVPDLPVRGIVTGTATLDGSTNTRLVARVDLTHLDRGARSRLAGLGAVRLGDVPWMDVDARALPLSLVTVGRFAPAVGLRGAAAGPIRLTGSLDDLALDARLRMTGGGTLGARGRFDLASREKAYDLSVGTEVFDVNAVVAKAPHTSLTANATARGRGFDPATMRATFAADVSTSLYDSVAVDSASVRVDVASGLARLDTLLVRAPNTAIEAGGTFGLAAGQEGALAYRVAVDSLSALARWLPRDTGVVAPRPAVVRRAVTGARADSARRAEEEEVARAAGALPPVRLVVDTPAVVRRDSLAGAVYAAGVVRGGLKGFDLRGRAGARDVAYGGNTLRELRSEYALVGGGTSRAALALAAQVDSASAGGFALDSVDARATYRFPADSGAAARGTAQVFVFQSDTTEYGVRADYTLNTDRNEAIFNRVGLRLRNSVWTAVHPSVLGWGPRGIDVDSLELRDRRNGRIFVNGLIPTEGRADLEVAIDNFEIADAVGLAQSDVQASGLLSVDARLVGTAGEPRLRGVVGVDGLRYSGTAMPDVHTTLDYADRTLKARLDVGREGGQPLLLATGTVPIDLALQGVTGSRFPDRPLTVDVVIDSLPLDVIPQFTDAVAQVRGLATGKVAVRGTLPDRLTYDGRLNLERGQARLVPAGITLRQMNGALRLAGDTLVIDSLVARSGGELRVRGGLGIAKPAAPTFDLHLRGTNALVLDNDRGRVRADIDVSLYGPYTNAFASGGVRIREGVIYLPEDTRGDVVVLNANDPAVFSVVDTTLALEDELVARPSPLVRNLRANVHLRVDRDTWVRSDEANVEIYSDGDLVIDVDQRREALTLEGVMGSERGEYTFAGKRFQITQGSATFIGTADINPLLQATAEYEVQIPGREALIIRLVIGGTAREPRLSLESAAQPPISQSDLISYLAFSRSSSSLLQFGGSSVSGTTSTGNPVGQTAALVQQKLAGLALGVFVQSVESDAARSLGADVFRITTTDVPVEISASRVGGFLRATEVEFGRYLTTRSYLGLQARPLFLTDPGQASLGIRYQYRMPFGLRVETSFEPRYILREPSLSVAAPQSTGVFGAFLIREWRF